MAILPSELELLVKSGLTPNEALKIATLSPAKYFNIKNELGWITKDRLANLLLLDVNTLEQKSNTKKINTIVWNGRFYNRNALNEILKN